MTAEQLIESFVAFNSNSINMLLYIIRTNFASLLTVGGALAIILMNLFEEMDDAVTERTPII